MSDRWLLPVAGRDERDLRAAADRIAARLTASDDPAGVARECFARAGSGPYRCVVRGAGSAQLVEGLTAVAAGESARGARRAVVPERPRVAFVYPGLGTAYSGMGAELAGEPAYAAAAERCDAVLADLAGWSLRAELAAAPADGRLTDSAVGLPALVAMQIMLTELLASWGVTPDVALGHSIGEVPAGYVTGGLRLADALAIAHHEGQTVRSGGGRGGMLAVGLGADAAARLVERYPALSVAADNGPAITVLAGDPGVLATLETELTDRKVFHRRLAIDHAYHSPQMDRYTTEFIGRLAGLSPRPTRIPLVSTLHGAVVAGERLDATHWAELRRRPVRFADAVSVARASASVFVEISPDPALGTALAQCLAGGPRALILPSLRAGEDAADCLRRTAAQLYLAGAPVRWSAVPAPAAADRPDPAAARAGIVPADSGPRGADGREGYERRVARLVGEVLGVGPDRVPADTGLFELGLRSVTAVRLAELLTTEFGATVPVTEIFDRPTVAALAELFAGEPDDARGGAGPARGPGDADEPVAVVGMACRVPGAESVAEFWDLLRDGLDATGPLPTDRWDTALHGGDRDTAGTIYSPRGGFLPDVAGFDAAFFGISPTEAESMDPQQRLLLEVAWHALEDAHVPPDGLRDSRSGVYVGLTTDDYKSLQVGDPALVDGYTGTGNLFSVAAGRLSYTLGLRGPCLAVDTACSSSLVTVHLAGHALRAGECDLALAGGVHLMLAPECILSLSRTGALSRDGVCRTFDAAADGYARGEGCAVVVLKRLSDAIRDGDHVVALIRGSAVNHDGASGGLTVPSGPAQRSVVREAVTAAGVEPCDIGYVEAHGTATPLGDPIELGSLGRTLGAGRGPDRPLLVGSVKTNLGHLEAAAGATGLIKVALALRHGWIPPHLHLREPSPRIPWRELPIEVPVVGRAWPAVDAGTPRLAGVSSFGISGTNAHVVLSDASPELAGDPPEDGAAAGDRAGAVLLPLSGRDPAAVRELARRYARLVRDERPAPLADLAAAAATGRAHLPYRVVVVAERRDELAERLDAVAAGPAAPDAVPARPPAVAFAFSGQGSQYPGMGVGLMGEPAFREALELCDEIVRDLVGESLLRMLHRADPDVVHQTQWTHILLFALQYALVRLWEAWGVRPGAVLGHSVGELAAACTAGVLSVRDALRLATLRGRLMQRLPEPGRMLSVTAGEAELAALLTRYPRVGISTLNGPCDTVLGGPVDQLASLAAGLDARGVATHELAVSYAGHSSLVEPVLDELEAGAATVEHRPAGIDMVSTVTGAVLAAGEVDAGYWRRNARRPVRFHDAARTLLDLGYEFVVDIGPDATLARIADRQGLLGARRRWLGSMRRGRDERTTALATAGALFTAGVPVDPAAVTGRPRTHVELPLYPFQHRRYWRDISRTTRRRGDHPLLGRPVRSPALRGTVYESEIGTPLPAHLADHAVYTVPVASAAYQLAAVIAAAEREDGAGCRLDDVVFVEPLILGAEPVTVQVVLGPGPGPRTFQVVSSTGDGDWTVHATGDVRAGVPAEPPADDDADLPVTDVPADELHDAMRVAGYELGPSYRWLDRVRSGDGTAVGSLRRPPTTASPAAGQYPGMIDSCLRLTFAAVPGILDGAREAGLPAPAEVGQVVWHGTGVEGPLSCRVRVGAADRTAEEVAADFTVYDARGTVVARIRRVRLRRLTRRALHGRTDLDRIRYELAWRETGPPAAGAGGTAAVGDWIVLADRGGVGARLAELLPAAGGRCHLVPAGAGDPAERVAALLTGPVGAPRGVVLLSTLDEHPAGEPDTGSLVATQRGGMLLAARLAQLAPAVPTLLLATRAAQTVLSTDHGRPDHATVHGLPRVVRLEHPDVCCTVLDLPDGRVEPAARAALAVMLAAEPEPQLAVRGDRWYAPRLVRAAPGGRVRIREGGGYLVTGGTGALGRRVARWLAGQGAGRVYLMGRRDVPELDQTWPGGEVRSVAGDVTDPDDLARVLAEVARDGGTLRGVVHAAGILTDVTLARHTGEQLLAPLLPKLAGAWNLHRATRDADLDFFVLFSSAAGVLGNAGQAGYAAGNAFLDALAAYRRRLGMPGVSVAWGPWLGDGMAGRLSARDRDRLTESGMTPLDPDDAIAALAYAASGAPRQLVVRADWARLAGRIGGDRRGLLREVLDTPAGGPAGADAGGCHPRPPGSGDYLEPRNERERTLATIWEDLLRIRPVGVSDDFLAFGGDSILGLRMVAAARRAGLSFSVADVFAHPTVGELAEAAGAAGGVDPAGAGRAEPVGSGGVEPAVSGGVEPAGSGVEPAGSGVERAGSGVERAGSGVEPAGDTGLTGVAGAAGTTRRSPVPTGPVALDVADFPGTGLDQDDLRTLATQLGIAEKGPEGRGTTRRVDEGGR